MPSQIFLSSSTQARFGAPVAAHALVITNQSQFMDGRLLGEYRASDELPGEKLVNHHACASLCRQIEAEFMSVFPAQKL